MAKSKKPKKPTSSKINLSRHRRIITILGVLLIGVVGTILLRLSSADNSASYQANCGRRVSNYNYQVPFGNAIWNQPICGMPRHPLSNELANRFLEWSHVNDGNPNVDYRNGNLGNNPGFPDKTRGNPLETLFTRERYYASDATTETKIGAVSYYSNLDGDDVNTFLPETTIPWNPAWETGQGGDNEMVILDDRPGPTQGRIYFISGYYANKPLPSRPAPIGCYLVAFPQNRICTYTVNVGRDLEGNYVDYRTYEGFISERGVGLSFYATLVTPEEVKAGEIRHAVGIAVPNTSYGSVCTPAQRGTAAENYTCGTAYAPATKFEWGGAPAPPVMQEPFKSQYGIDKTIPEGTLFALDVTDQEIEDWIRSRPNLANNKRKADTARVYAVALRDYGMMVVDTNGNRAGIQNVGGINPENAAKWEELGMGPNEKDDMIEGLINKDNLYVVNPPVATCKDGTKSRHFCQWTSIAYEGGPNQTPAPEPEPVRDTKAPIIEVNSPLNNSNANGIIDVAGKISDDSNIKSVEIFVNSNSVYSTTGKSFSHKVDTTKMTNGSHSISIKAVDEFDNEEMISITINVSNQTVAPKKSGDYNNDNKVDVADLIILINNYNRPGGAESGDSNGDGKVDIFDLAILLSQLNK